MYNYHFMIPEGKWGVFDPDGSFVSGHKEMSAASKETDRLNQLQAVRHG